MFYNLDIKFVQKNCIEKQKIVLKFLLLDYSKCKLMRTSYMYGNQFNGIGLFCCR